MKEAVVKKIYQNFIYSNYSLLINSVFIGSIPVSLILGFLLKDRLGTNYSPEFLIGSLMLFVITTTIYDKVKSPDLYQMALREFDTLGIDIGKKVKHVNGYTFDEMMKDTFKIEKFDEKIQKVLLSSSDNKYEEVMLNDLLKNYVSIE